MERPAAAPVAVRAQHRPAQQQPARLQVRAHQRGAVAGLRAGVGARALGRDRRAHRRRKGARRAAGLNPDPKKPKATRSAASFWVGVSQVALRVRTQRLDGVPCTHAAKPKGPETTCVQPTMIEGSGTPNPTPEEAAERDHGPSKPEWTAEHAARAADALDGAYSPDFQAEADVPEVRSHDAQRPARHAAPCHARLCC